MAETETQRGHAFTRLVEVMGRLLAPGGCPWDREQTLESLRPYLVEETYEVLDVMTGDDPAEHCEELGDLLMQIVFQAAIRGSAGEFDVDDVANAISDKLVRRHPHVFGDATADDAKQVLQQWSEIKAQERRAKGGGDGPDRTLRGVPRSMPALARAQQLSVRASRVGFDWPDVAGCRAKVSEELEEIDQAIAGGNSDEVEAEIGDLLFALVSLSRKLDIDAEGALRKTTDRFASRFEFIEDQLHADNRSPKQSNLEEMDRLWQAAKLRPKN